VAGGLNAKFDFVKEIINDKKPTAFFILESNLRDNKCNKHLSIKGYDLIVTSSHFSRTACYLLKNSNFKVTSVGNGNEVIGIENEKIKILGVYRPFKLLENETLASNFDRLMTHLEKEATTDKEIIVSGDFNVDLAGKNCHMKNSLETWVSDNGLSQLVDRYTRQRVVNRDSTQTIERSVLDHFYTNAHYTCRLEEHFASDHMILSCEIPSEIPRTVKVKRRDWRLYKPHTLARQMETMTGRIEEIKSKTLPETMIKGVNAILQKVLNKLAPERTSVTRRNQDIIDSSVTALIKRRNRIMAKFKKTQNIEYKIQAKALTKDLKKLVKKKTKEKFEKKACTKNQRDFWSVINEITGKQRHHDTLQLKNGNIIIQDPEQTCEIVADYFENKIKGLCQKTGLFIPVPVPETPHEDHQIKMPEIIKALKKMKRKKSCGTDGIPMCLIVDTFHYFDEVYLKIFNLCLHGIPAIWKKAMVKPLHKSGDKTDVANYRPISNLRSLEKLFERVILQSLEELDDGPHQHGFKTGCSTTTAMLVIQSKISGLLDENKKVVVYSLDLSAAFDMLRVDEFFTLFKHDMPKWLMKVIVDFLTKRKCVVEVDGCLSKEKDVPIGCVQGSVLGPRLFNLYTSKIPKCFAKDVTVVSYADDTYVIISGDTEEEVCEKTEANINKHVETLLRLGMIVNSKKTEAVYFSKTGTRLKFKCQNEEIMTGPGMKVLGVYFDEKLSWTPQIKTTINKISRLTSGLKFLRKRLSKRSFLKATISQFYGLLYYGSQVWLGSHTKVADIRRLNSVHYKLLRIVENDWKKSKRRADLDKIGRAKPSLWAKYSTANLVLKVMKTRLPQTLHASLVNNSYATRRNPSYFSMMHLGLNSGIKPLAID